MSNLKKPIAPVLKQMKIGEIESFELSRSATVRTTIDRLKDEGYKFQTKKEKKDQLFNVMRLK